MIPDGAFVHQSVERRMQLVPDYRPINYPLSPRIVPMPDGPDAAEPVEAEEAD